MLRGLRRLAVFSPQLLRTCGAPDPVEKRASGEGTVYATSLVCRAATPETRAHIPYNIVLVDTAEGFRMMAHGDPDLAIGDHVTVRFCRSPAVWFPISQRQNDQACGSTLSGIMSFIYRE